MDKKKPRRTKNPKAVETFVVPYLRQKCVFIALAAPHSSLFQNVVSNAHGEGKGCGAATKGVGGNLDCGNARKHVAC